MSPPQWTAKTRSTDRIHPAFLMCSLFTATYSPLSGPAMSDYVFLLANVLYNLYCQVTSSQTRELKLGFSSLLTQFNAIQWDQPTEIDFSSTCSSAGSWDDAHCIADAEPGMGGTGGIHISRSSSVVGRRHHNRCHLCDPVVLDVATEAWPARVAIRGDINTAGVVHAWGHWANLCRFGKHPDYRQNDVENPPPEHIALSAFSEWAPHVSYLSNNEIDGRRFVNCSRSLRCRRIASQPVSPEASTAPVTNPDPENTRKKNADQT
jgi:hypothetical protein